MGITASKSQSNGNYTPCPEYTGRAVCVDITPLKEYETQFGTKRKFKIAFEIDLRNDTKHPVQPWVVMTAPMTVSLHDKAALTKLLRDWFGRALTPQETSSFDLDTLIGRPASLVIVHEASQDGSKTFANIRLIQPHKHGAALQPSGLWVRIQDRPPREEQITIPTPAPAAPVKTTDVKVHVGKFQGVLLSELTSNAVRGLAEHWLPKAQVAAEKSPQDKLLIAALIKRMDEIEQAKKPTFDDDIPF